MDEDANDTDTEQTQRTTSQALAVRAPEFMPLSFNDTMELAEVLARSGYFKDTKTAAQAAAKIFAGAEYKIPPMIALQNVYVIDGKTALSDVLIGMLVERSDRYDYRVVVSTDKECRIAFFRDGELRGTQTWTIGQARDAGLLSKDNWRKYPEAMLYARCLSAGVKKYIPGVLLGGAVYTPDELEPGQAGRVNGATGEILDADFRTPDLATSDQKAAIHRGFTAWEVPVPRRNSWLSERSYPPLHELSHEQADAVLKLLAHNVITAIAPEPEQEPEQEPAQEPEPEYAEIAAE